MKRTILILSFLVAFGILGWVTIFFNPDSVSLTERVESEKSILYYPEYAFDVSDKELLVGDTPNIVIAKVKSKVDETKDDIGPITIYTVEVLEELKGVLESDSISVVQRIGYDAAAGGTLKVEGDEYLAKGNSYILLLRYDPMLKKHRIVAPKHGNILVKEQGDSTYNKAIMTEFEKAIEKQRIPEY